MAKRRRCPFCRGLFTPDPRVKERQKSCGRQPCRKEQKRRYDQLWRVKHPDYFRGMYPQQKEAYGTRADYKKEYRKRNPEYVGRNAAYVTACRKRQRQGGSGPVSPTSCDLRLSLWSKRSSVSITQVSHTSSDIFVRVCEQEAYSKTARVSPTSFDSPQEGLQIP